MVGSSLVEEKIALIFSWDPKRRVWIRERGPEDAAAPPAEPIDNEAVQTYYLDPTNGRWEATILGDQARRVAYEMKGDYRTPYMPGLAMKQAPQIKPRFVVEQETSPAGSGGRTRLVAGAAVLLVLAAGGALVAQPFLSAPADADGTFHPSAPSPMLAVPTSATGASGPAAVPSPVAPSPSAASPAATAAASTAATARPAAPAPTASPPPTTITLSVKTAGGAQIFYRGPNSIAQNTVVAVDFSVILPQGQRGDQTLIVYLGPIGATPPMSGSGDSEGRYNISLKATVAKGTQSLAVAYGNDPTIYPLGTIVVR